MHERLALHRLDQAKQRKNKRRRRCARVVKGLDSKSNGVTRAGSNPADVVLFLLAVLMKFVIFATRIAV